MQPVICVSVVNTVSKRLLYVEFIDLGKKMVAVSG